ncbi:MAG: tricarballylate utilization 4Fe-4S protein TcuB [Alphaproteobacteria bacterium]|jgi:citrate/tricarballylate utilization protein
MSATELTHDGSEPEVRHSLEICNACRYCEGYCAVFPAMELRREFSDADLGYLANLCHNCAGCFHSCQYAPPHEFGVNLPQAFTNLRVETYGQHAWPAPFARLFERNGLVVSLATALALGLVLLAVMALQDWDVLNGVHRGDGAFYAVIPHNAMVAVGGLTFGYALVAMAMAMARFWRVSGGGGVSLPAVAGALHDAATTRYLGGGGDGCNDVDDRFSSARRHSHLATMWGFILCFAATCAGTVYDYGFGWVAPYSWYSLPVLLGTVGGIMLSVGTFGLFAVKLRADRAPVAMTRLGMDYGFLALLFFTATTGLALLAFRHTAGMGMLLAIHLGFVLALFLTLPYGKFVHAPYRLLALIRYRMEAPHD